MGGSTGIGIGTIITVSETSGDDELEKGKKVKKMKGQR